LAEKADTAGKKKRRARGLPQSFEFAAMTAGFRRVAGTDEAGRGPLAGPVVAAAVILGPECGGLGLNDSKKISPKRREKLYDAILESAVAARIVSVGVVMVDRLNILNASLLAMKTAIEELEVRPDFVSIAGNRRIDIQMPQTTLVGGDASCCSIAAASILAKVSRDRQMKEYEELYPGYGFAQHKGYGTREHMQALRELGPSPIHRRSFSPVRELL